MTVSRALIVGIIIILGISAFTTVWVINLRKDLNSTEKTLQTKLSLIERFSLVPVLEGIEMGAIGEHRVKTISYDIKFTPEEDFLLNTYRQARPGLIHAKYELVAGKKEVTFHPLEWAHNVLNAASYAEQANRLNESRPLIDTLVKQAMEHATKSGPAWYLGYPFRFRLADKTLEKPWFSGIAQAYVMAAWIKLYRVTGEKKFKDLAEETYRSFLQIRTKEGQEAPWVSFVDKAGYLWFEEYPSPTDPQPRVLNGHICAIMGLYSYYRLEPNPETLAMIRAGITTVCRYFNEFRRPGAIPNYYLIGEHADYSPGRAVVQQEWLYKITGDVYIKQTWSALKTDVSY